MAVTARSDAGTTGRLVRSGLWPASAIAAANVLNAAFQVVLARALTPGEYSLAVTLFAAVMVLGVPALAVQTAVARDVAARLAAGDGPGAGLVLRESSRSLLYVSPRSSRRRSRRDPRRVRAQRPAPVAARRDRGRRRASRSPSRWSGEVSRGRSASSRSASASSFRSCSSSSSASASRSPARGWPV